MTKMILLTGFFPALCYAFAFPLGYVSYVPSVGPVGSIEPRGLASYLLVVICVAVAEQRYRPSVLSLSSLLISFATILFTASRTALALGAVIVAFLWLDFRRIFRWGLTFALVIVAAIWLGMIPHRFTDNISDEFPYIDTEGRWTFWEATFTDWLEHPVLGNGPGSARVVVGNIVDIRDTYAEQSSDESGEYFPHNEYLQALHDTGIIGLALFLFAYCPMLMGQWRSWKQSPSSLTLAAFLLPLFLMSEALTGNDMHMVFLGIPTFMIVGASMNAGSLSVCSSVQTGGQPDFEAA
jgi:O-antigen ligase